MVLGEVTENLEVSHVKPKNFGVLSSQADVRKRVFSYMASNSKTSRTVMVIAAIGAIGTDERGASIPAITKWIIGNYAVPDISKLKTQIKKAILKGLDDGKIGRSLSSKRAMGYVGSFVLNERNSSSPKERGNSKTRKIKHKAKE